MTLSAAIKIDPFIAPAHRELIEKAEAQLIEYDAALLLKLQARIDTGGAVAPHPREVRKAQEEFLNDPFRRGLLRLIGDMRALFEQPRLIIREPQKEAT